MMPQQKKEHTVQLGMDTVMFSKYGRNAGQISIDRFDQDWNKQLQLGGGAQAMQARQSVKGTYYR